MNSDKNLNDSSDEKFRLYCDRVKNDFCPFLSPSIKAELIFFESVAIDAKNNQFLESEFFWLMMARVKRFCAMRKTLNASQKNLLCFNVEFTYPEQLAVPYGERRFEIPYWILRKIFTAGRIIIGDFWLGEKEITKQGRLLPEPNLNFFSIRSMIKSLDDRFIEASPELADDYQKSFSDFHFKHEDDILIKYYPLDILSLENRLSEYNKIRFDVYHV